MMAVYVVSGCKYSFATCGVATEAAQLAIDKTLARAAKVNGKRIAARLAKRPSLPNLPTAEGAAKRIAEAMSGEVLIHRETRGTWHGTRETVRRFTMDRPVRVGKPLPPLVAPGPVCEVSRLQVRVGSEWLTRCEVQRRHDLLEMVVAS